MNRLDIYPENSTLLSRAKRGAVVLSAVIGIGGIMAPAASAAEPLRTVTNIDVTVDWPCADGNVTVNTKGTETITRFGDMQLDQERLTATYAKDGEVTSYKRNYNLMFSDSGNTVIYTGLVDRLGTSVMAGRTVIQGGVTITNVGSTDTINPCEA